MPVAGDTDRQVRAFLRKWADAQKSMSIGDLTDLYFSKDGVTRAGVRAERELDTAKYGRMIVCDV